MCYFLETINWAYIFLIACVTTGKIQYPSENN